MVLRGFYDDNKKIRKQEKELNRVKNDDVDFDEDEKEMPEEHNEIVIEKIVVL